MSHDSLEAIVRGILYQGYLLWPYRRGAAGGGQRVSYQGLYPSRYCASARQGDRPSLHCQCLVEGARSRQVTVELRFLHLLHRQVLQRMGEQERPVDELRAGGEVFLTWDEAVERRSTLPATSLGELAADPLSRRLGYSGGAEREAIRGDRGERVGTLHRSWLSLGAVIRVAAEPLRRGLYRLTIEVSNDSDWHGLERGEAHRHALLAAHLVLGADGAQFVSVSDPPERLAAAAAGCRSQGVWPVLVGDPEARDRMLASPVPLEDFPSLPETLPEPAAPSRGRSRIPDTATRSLLPGAAALV